MGLGNFQGRPFRAWVAVGLKDHAFWVAGECRSAVNRAKSPSTLAAFSRHACSRADVGVDYL